MINIGIYKITNLLNEKCYIGSSLNITERWYQHKTKLLHKKHHSIKLQRAINKYGMDNFKYDIIEECNQESLIIREQYYIDFFDSYKNGYNSTPKAGNNLGMKHSEETKEKLKKASMGNKNMLNKSHTDETKNIISEKLKGRTLSEETKKKMCNRIISEETREKLKGRIPWNKGCKMSEEYKKKLSLSHLGKKQSKETIENRVKLNTGKKRTEEVKKKMSESMTGIKKGTMSEEHKLKISKTLKEKYKNRNK